MVLGAMVITGDMQMSDALSDFIVAVITFAVGLVIGYTCFREPAEAHEYKPVTTQISQYTIKCTKFKDNVCEEYTLFKTIKE